MNDIFSGQRKVKYDTVWSLLIFQDCFRKLHPDKQDVSSSTMKQLMRFWSGSIGKDGQRWENRVQVEGKKVARRMFKCSEAPGPSAWKLWVCVLRQDQFQFASTSRCGVNNGGLVANMHSVMERGHNDIMIVCDKMALLRRISCFSHWIWSLGGLVRFIN